MSRSSRKHLHVERDCTYMSPMSRQDVRTFARTTMAFAALADHARLPGRFHARLSATCSRLRA
jgi:hypothetical protein